MRSSTRSIVDDFYATTASDGNASAAIFRTDQALAEIAAPGFFVLIHRKKNEHRLTG
jgi:hypothetical protein